MEQAPVQEPEPAEAVEAVAPVESAAPAPQVAPVDAAPVQQQPMPMQMPMMVPTNMPPGMDPQQMAMAYGATVAGAPKVLDGMVSMHGEEEEDDDDEDGTGEPPKKKRGGHGRRKIEIEYIEDKIRRHITFSKRKAGISKKAYELSRLTGAQVLLLISSERGQIYSFATPKLQPILVNESSKALIEQCLNAPDPMAPMMGAPPMMPPEMPPPQLQPPVHPQLMPPQMAGQMAGMPGMPQGSMQMPPQMPPGHPMMAAPGMQPQVPGQMPHMMPQGMPTHDANGMPLMHAGVPHGYVMGPDGSVMAAAPPQQ